MMIVTEIAPLVVHVPIHMGDVLIFKAPESQNLKHIHPPKRMDTFDIHKDILWQWKIHQVQ